MRPGFVWLPLAANHADGMPGPQWARRPSNRARSRASFSREPGPAGFQAAVVSGPGQALPPAGCGDPVESACPQPPVDLDAETRSLRHVDEAVLADFRRIGHNAEPAPVFSWSWTPWWSRLEHLFDDRKRLVNRLTPPRTSTEVSSDFRLGWRWRGSSSYAAAILRSG